MLKEPNWDKAPSLIQVPLIPINRRMKRSVLEIDRHPQQQYEVLTPDTVAELPRALPLTMESKSKPGLTLAGNRGTHRGYAETGSNAIMPNRCVDSIGFPILDSSRSITIYPKGTEFIL